MVIALPYYNSCGQRWSWHQYLRLSAAVIFSAFLLLVSNLFFTNGLVCISTFTWVILVTAVNLGWAKVDSIIITNPYRCWLVLMTALVLVFILIFRKDKLTVILFNVLALNTAVFFWTRNVIIFYIRFEFSLIPMVALIIMRGYQPERYGARLWFLLYTIVGSLPLLYVILTVRGQRGTRCILLRGRVRNTLVLPVLLAFMVKLPVFGIHLWLPKAHVQAPVRGRMFLAAVLLKIGGYGIFFIKCLVGVRLSVFLPFIIFSVLGSTIAMMFCMMLDDMKQVIAYRRIGHIGLVVGTVLSDNEIGLVRRLLIIVGHGFTRSLIFYLGNEAYGVRGSRRLRLTKGLIMVSPILRLCLGSALILNISFPPSINVFGEIRAIISIISTYPRRIGLLLLLVLLGGLFNMKLYLSVRHGTCNRFTPRKSVSVPRMMVRVRHVLPYLLLPFIVVCL